MKKLNNKGFSLVELIIVIAIMAVLIGVLAPQYIRYVEKSRIQTDDSAAASIKDAVTTAISDPDVYDKLGTSSAGSVIKWSSDGIASVGRFIVAKEVFKTIDTNQKIASTKYKSSSYVVSIEWDNNAGSWKAVGDWK